MNEKKRLFLCEHECACVAYQQIEWINTFTFAAIWVRWNYFMCRWYCKNDKRTNGLKKKNSEQKRAWISECISAFVIWRKQRHTHKKNEMLVSIFTAACKLLFDNIFTWVPASARVCVSTLNYADRIKIYTHHLPFSRHICTYACLLVSFFCCCCCWWGCEAQDWLYHASEFCVESVILWERWIQQKSAEWIYKKHVAFSLDAP